MSLRGVPTPFSRTRLSPRLSSVSVGWWSRVLGESVFCVLSTVKNVCCMCISLVWRWCPPMGHCTFDPLFQELFFLLFFLFPSVLFVCFDIDDRLTLTFVGKWVEISVVFVDGKRVRILQVLGRGAFSSVYKVGHTAAAHILPHLERRAHPHFFPSTDFFLWPCWWCSHACLSLFLSWEW